MVFGFLMVSLASSSQRNDAVDSILREGELLYRLEMASWHATDLVLRKHKDKAGQIGGYFSYEQGRQVSCVFYSKSVNPAIIATVSFDTSLNTATARVATNQRKFTRHEEKLYNIRKQALAEINTDKLFSRYEHTSFNLIPYADSSHGKVFVLTEPQVSGVVIFGNDYLLVFDGKDSLLHKQSLHPTIIPVDFGKDDDPELRETFHLHGNEAGKFISPTDICTLLLYHRFAKWSQHLVMSKSHVCAWDLLGNKLKVYTTDEWSRENNNKKLVGVGF